MTFTYEFVCGSQVDMERDEIYEDTEYFEYEVDYPKVRIKLAEFLSKKYNIEYDKVLKLIKDYDLDEFENFYEELKDLFEDEAYEEYKDIY